VRLVEMVVTANQISIEVCRDFITQDGPGRSDCEGYPKYKKTFGKDQAMKILQNEQVCNLLLLIGSDGEWSFLWLKETLSLLTQVADEEKIDCDLWRGHTFGQQGIQYSVRLAPLTFFLRCCAESIMRR